MAWSSRRRRAARKVKPGDGRALQRFRWWQPLTRSLLHLRLAEPDGTQHVWSIDVRHGGDDGATVYADLYRDRQHHASSRLPASFPAPGGVIEVATSGYGLKRCHYVADAGGTWQLTPDPASAAGRRARLDREHPVLGRAIGVVSIVVLVVGLVLGVPQIVEDVTRIPPVADVVGTFTSPFRLPVWANISILVATLLASTERALRLRYSRLLDSGLFDGDF